MASKRNIRRRKCGKKKRYETERGAKQAIYRLANNSAAPIGFLRAYKCPFCHGWHFGHTRKVA